MTAEECKAKEGNELTGKTELIFPLRGRLSSSIRAQWMDTLVIGSSQSGAMIRAKLKKKSTKASSSEIAES